MSKHIPIRDQGGQISGFAAILDDTMQQLGFTPAPAPPPTPAAPAPAPAPTRWPRWVLDLEAHLSPTALATAFGGLLAMLLIVVLARSMPSTGASTTAAPTAAPITIIATPTIAPAEAAQDAYAAPNGPMLGKIPAGVAAAFQDSRNSGWAGIAWEGGVVWVRSAADLSALRDLAPPPTATAAPPLAEPPDVAAPIIAPPTYEPPTYEPPTQAHDANPPAAGNKSIVSTAATDAAQEQAERDQERATLRSADNGPGTNGP